MNDRKRQRKRALDMMMRSRSREGYGLSNLSDAPIHFSENLAPLVNAFGEFTQRLRVLSDALCGKPVNVIRCEKCKYFITHEELPGSTFCMRLCRPVAPDFYCAFGTRKDDR